MTMMNRRREALRKLKWRPELQDGSTRKDEDEEGEHPLDPSRPHELRKSGDQSVTGASSDQKRLNQLRLISIGLWVAVAALASFTVFKLSRRAMDQIARSEFRTIASEVTEGFITNIHAKMATAYTVSVSLTAMLPYEGVAPNVTFSLFDELSIGALLTSSGSRVVWSPLLVGKDLSEWDAYVQAQPQHDTGMMDSACYICGSQYGTVGLPASTIQIKNETYRCGDLEKLGLSGMLSSEKCGYVATLATSNCNCSFFDQQTDTKKREPWRTTVFQLVNGSVTDVHGRGPFAPVWQVFPTDTADSIVMYDQMSDTVRRSAMANVLEIQVPVLGGAPDVVDGYGGLVGGQPQMPSTAVFAPVFDSVAAERVIGSISIDFDWSTILNSALPVRSDGLVCVIENSLGNQLAYSVKNGSVVFEGASDLHDKSHDSWLVESTYDDFLRMQRSTSPLVNSTNLESSANSLYRVRVYASKSFEQSRSSSFPSILAATVFGFFLFNLAVFIAYDCMMKTRQEKIVQTAKQTDAIVSSMFPPVVRDRLLRQAETKARYPKSKKRFPRIPLTPKLRLASMLRDSTPLDIQLESNSQPIADLFQHTTVLFADISGFTAWSSSREPCQVFKLLETVYSCFDSLAHKLGVFKVETIGDCYVAVTGLPEPQEDHAVIMSEFASECLINMRDLVKQLETTLGPGTADLALRIGMHSGPVTAGVLRGEKSRFQLFGDTMNTASRMESTGQAQKIQVSQATADLLIKSSKAHWLIQRDELVFAKGKGDLQTFWVKPDRKHSSNVIDIHNTSTRSLVSTDSFDLNMSSLSLFDSRHHRESDTAGKLDRLIDWNVELLLGLIHNIVARRNLVEGRRRRRSSTELLVIPDLAQRRKSNLRLSRYSSDILEVVEAVNMPPFSEKAPSLGDPTEEDLANLGEEVRYQLREFVGRVAARHKMDNPFHNFEHASTVALSANKLMKRIINPENVDYEQDAIPERDRRKTLAHDIHDASFGISSDPLMQFAVVFAALIHNIDHPGVPNEQLVSDEDEIAVEYKGRSITEQHAIETAWRMFMEGEFEALRHCVCHTDYELKRFHQLVVNAVVATDIEDDDLAAWRQNRWRKAFGPESLKAEFDMERKATIVFESVIQVSDISFTMQHWHIYTKWNERLFAEKLKAFLIGRSDDDPSFSWYHDELGFFDQYVIPLAKRLEDCQVFGVSSEEYLTYAVGNRNEWESKGRDMVCQMVDRYNPRKLTRQSFSAIPA